MRLGGSVYGVKLALGTFKHKIRHQALSWTRWSEGFPGTGGIYHAAAAGDMESICSRLLVKEYDHTSIYPPMPRVALINPEGWLIVGCEVPAIRLPHAHLP